MRKTAANLAIGALLALGATGLALAGGSHGSTAAEEGHTKGAGMIPDTFDEARAAHQAHEHGHDFEAMEEMSPEKRDRIIALMRGNGLRMPPMGAERGRHVFLEKGCIACHSVNGVGGDLGPALNAADMPRPMNAFEFAARMWRGAEAMIALQEDLLGEVISLNGQELADLVAFAHDEAEQARLTEDQIPERFHSLIAE